MLKHVLSIEHLDCRLRRQRIVVRHTSLASVRPDPHIGLARFLANLDQANFAKHCFNVLLRHLSLNTGNVHHHTLRNRHCRIGTFCRFFHDRTRIGGVCRRNYLGGLCPRSSHSRLVHIITVRVRGLLRLVTFRKRGLANRKTKREKTRTRAPPAWPQHLAWPHNSSRSKQHTLVERSVQARRDGKHPLQNRKKKRSSNCHTLWINGWLLARHRWWRRAPSRSLVAHHTETQKQKTFSRLSPRPDTSTFA